MNAPAPLIEIENLVVEIQSMPALRGFSMRVPKGAMVSLVGRNGAGKTTLMRSIMGHLGPVQGSVRFEGVDLSSRPRHTRAALGIGYMPEDRRLVPEFTVEENIRLPTWSTQVDGVDQRLEWIFSLMPEVARFNQRRALELSGGQQKMVALARALMAGTRILLLDEPFEGLAPALARRLGEVLANLMNEGVSMLIAESNEIHIIDLGARLFHRARRRYRQAIARPTSRYRFSVHTGSFRGGVPVLLANARLMIGPT